PVARHCTIGSDFPVLRLIAPALAPSPQRLSSVSTQLYLTPMKQVLFAAIVVLLAAGASSDVLARGKQTQSQKEPEMCVVPPGAQPLLPAKLLPGMGITKNFPVTTSSEEARKFFLQGVSQIHSFWFQE